MSVMNNLLKSPFKMSQIRNGHLESLCCSNYSYVFKLLVFDYYTWRFNAVQATYITALKDFLPIYISFGLLPDLHSTSVNDDISICQDTYLSRRQWY